MIFGAKFRTRNQNFERKRIILSYLMISLGRCIRVRRNLEGRISHKSLGEVCPSEYDSGAKSRGLQSPLIGGLSHTVYHELEAIPIFMYVQGIEKLGDLRNPLLRIQGPSLA